MSSVFWRLLEAIIGFINSPASKAVHPLNAFGSSLEVVLLISLIHANAVRAFFVEISEVGYTTGGFTEFNIFANLVSLTETLCFRSLKIADELSAIGQYGFSGNSLVLPGVLREISGYSLAALFRGDHP